MKYLLDTNVWIAILKQQPGPVLSRVIAEDQRHLVLPCVALAELRYGADKSQQPTRNHQAIDYLTASFPVVDFDAESAQV